MKRLIILTGIVFLFLGLQAQVDHYNDRAPGEKVKENSVQSKQSNTFLDRDPNAKAIPIPSDAMFDLIFEYPCAVGDGEAGIETDGIFIYTTKWNGDQFYKYEIDGTFLDTLIIPGVSNIRDLAYDGTYFFGGAASTTVYELDFENSILISSFTAPTDVRAIAYNDYEDVFYANNWGSDIIRFDKSGNLLGSFSVGPVGDSYYGFAYDEVGTSYTTSLWGYAQVGATQNEIIEMALPDGNETGVYFDVGSVTSVENGIAGGLCIENICYDITIIGLAQNEIIWGLELWPLGCCPENDLGIHSIIEPASGVGYTNNEPVTIKIENFGINPQTTFIVSFKHNGSPPYYDTVFAIINFGETFDFTFDTTINMATGETHILEACTNLAGDECTLNDCKTKVLWTSLFGNLEGYLTNCESGVPIEGGSVCIAGNTVITGNDGYFYFESLPVGTWELTFSAPGYCTPSSWVMVTIEVGQTTSADICLSPAQFDVEPDTLFVTINPNGISSATITLNNPGVCSIDWTGLVDIISKDMYNLLFEYPTVVGGGEAGIETDGEYIYTTKWNGNEFYKYSLNGLLIETFTINGVTNIRDLAWDGTYFYGGAASTTVFIMDFDNQTLISSFIAPTNVRAIAYNDNENVFYANNWDSDIIKFDVSGTMLGSFLAGPVGDSYYGFAYDNITGGTYLWGYAQVGASQNELIQMELPDGQETGVCIDIGATLSGSVTSLAGGLFIETGMPLYSFVIGGLVQNEWLWGIGMTSCPWLFLNPNSGTLTSGMAEYVSLDIESSCLSLGIHEADIFFTSNPDTDTSIVHLILNIINTDPPINLTISNNCVEAELCWEVPPDNYPDSFSVYNNNQLIMTTTNYCYTFEGPENYECYVTAWYNDQQSEQSDIITFEIPWPADSKPVNFIIDSLTNNTVYTSWDEPTGCAEPDGYNVYRDGIKLNDSIILQLSYPDTSTLSSGVYEYYATAVYFFGESDSSNIELLTITNLSEAVTSRIKIFPIPTSEYIYLQSDDMIKNIRIYNNSGQLVFDNKPNSTKYKINVSMIESGIYLIKLDTKEANLIRKIIIE